MTWSRFDDGWSDREDLADVSFEARWHLFALISFCSRTHRYDGRIRTADARRASDVPDPKGAAAELVAAGHLRVVEGGVELVHIKEHVPPPSMRDERRKSGQNRRKRDERKRKGKTPAAAPDPSEVPVERDNAREVTKDVTRDTGTGRDGPLGEPNIKSNDVTQEQPEDDEAEQWAAYLADDTSDGHTLRIAGTTDTCDRCGLPSAQLDGGLCRRDDCVKARRRGAA